MRKQILLAVSLFISVFVSGQGQWTQMSNSCNGNTRYGAAGFSIGNFGYVCLGSSAGNDLWKYDPISDTWTLTVFPNPSTTGFKVILNETNNHSDFNFSLYNALGEPVLSEKIEHEKYFDRKNLPAGIYFYNLTSENSIIGTGKLIISNRLAGPTVIRICGPGAGKCGAAL